MRLDVTGTPGHWIVTAPDLSDWTRSASDLKREQTPGSLPRLTAVVMAEMYSTGLGARDRLDPALLRKAALARDPAAQKAPVTRPCSDCQEPMTKRNTRGRWPSYCPACRDARRARPKVAAA